ncbi:response regulator [Thalassotalea euphylliae]|uniref:response regulator n=1 Tax=Thalassotalea euphylliae TaxID=1655234 RepID=UPI003637DE2A
MAIPNITALLVDDEPSNIDVLRGLLPEQVKVKAAISGQLALRIAGKVMPDVVFLDVQMPGMSGDETATQLRELPGADSIKIVYVSGTELPADVSEQDGFLLKPVDKIKVENTLATLFGEA